MVTVVIDQYLLAKEDGETDLEAWENLWCDSSSVRQLPWWHHPESTPKDCGALTELASWFERGGIPPKVATHVAEDMVREFLWTKWNTRNGVRIGEMKGQVGNLLMAVKRLQGAISSSDSWVRQTVGQHCFMEVVLQEAPASQAPPWWSQDWKTELSHLALLEKGLQLALIDPLFNSDEGGPRSGKSDPDGVGAKAHLARVAHDTLKALGLKHGGNRGGHLSRFISLASKAADGEDPCPWADKYAAQVVRELKTKSTI